MYAVSTCTAHSIHPDRRPEARLVVSNDVPCEGERHYATDALTRFAMRVLDEHVIGQRDEYTSRKMQDGHAASAHRGACPGSDLRADARPDPVAFVRTDGRADAPTDATADPEELDRIRAAGVEVHII